MEHKIKKKLEEEYVMPPGAKTDPFGSYTGVTAFEDDYPVQDADDL